MSNPQHGDFSAILLEIAAGKRDLPNFKEVPLARGVAALACSGGPISRVESARLDGKRLGYARYAFGSTQGGVFDGTGYVMLYAGGVGKIGTFAICEHEKVPGRGGNPDRGWHPGTCSKCGLDMTVDSGD